MSTLPLNRTPARFPQATSDCRSCRLSTLCLPTDLDTHDVAAFAGIVRRPRPMERGEYLYRDSTPFRAIYAIRSGALKEVRLSVDGEEHITGFYLPGEVIGLDSIDQPRHPGNAVALEATQVCEIPFESLERLSERVPGLQRKLVRLISRELFDEQSIARMLGKRTAEQRLATVLLDLSGRFARRRLSPYRFRLPMSRHDLGNHLGLAPETMSRLFKRLEEQGLLSTAGKEITLHDMDGLHRLAGLDEPAPADDRNRLIA